MGTAYRELIDGHRRRRRAGTATVESLRAVGPVVGYLPASMLDLPLDWNAMAAAGSMVGSGAIVVCAEGRCMLDMALNCGALLPQ